jgi:hypothetical protein
VVALARLQATEIVSLATWNTLWEASSLHELAEPAAPSPWASFGYGLFVGRKQLEA